MRRKGISYLFGLYLVVFFLSLFCAGTVRASGIFETVTPHPGTELENCVAQLRQYCDPCGPWDQDVLLSSSAQAPLYRQTWETGCYGSWYQWSSGGHLLKYCNGSNIFLGGDVYSDIYNAGPTCSKIGQSIRVIWIGGDWDPATYDKTTIYAPDTYMVTDKNAGSSCSGMCDTVVADGGEVGR